MNLRNWGIAALCLVALGGTVPAGAAPAEQDKPTAQAPAEAKKPAPKLSSREAFELATKSLEKHDYKGALGLYSQALESNPGFVKAHVFRGVCYFMLDNPRKAVNDLDRSLELDPENPEGLFYRAQALFFLGDSRTALKDYERFLALVPENSPARLQKAMAHFRLGQYDAVITEASRSIAANPRNADAFALRGGAYWRKDSQGPAKDDFQAATTLRPENALFQLLYYVAREFSGESGKADLEAFYAKAANKQAWPYPAVAMMLGKATPQECFKAAQAVADSPYAKDITEAQAYFFTGCLFKIKKNEAKFEEYLALANKTSNLYLIQGMVKQRFDRAK